MEKARTCMIEVLKAVIGIALRLYDSNANIGKSHTLI